MEKCLSLILSFVMALAISAPAFAVDSADLLTIATQLIQVEQKTDDNGTAVTTYNNLHDFSTAVRNAHPEISDYEIATFLLDYIGEDYRGLPKEEILHYLSYDNITTSTTYVMVDNDGNTYSIDAVPYDVWVSDNGYMQIVTDFSYLDRIGRENYYSVWARATWLKYPAMHMEDAFVLGTSGTFDSNYDEVGSVSQTFYCNQCRRYTHRDRFVDNNNRVDGDLVLAYENFVPNLSFAPIPPQCDYCSGGVIMDTYFSVYTRYGMVADESENIQAGYAHKTVGPGSISVGIDIKGTPNFSSSFFATSIDKYIARAIAVD